MAKNDPQSDKSPRIVNRKARHDYHIAEVLECGVELTGTEVKSLRAGQAKLDGAFARVRNGELWLVDAEIAPYPMAAPGMQHDPKRYRRLLVHRRQVPTLEAHVRQKGQTIVPLTLYFKRGWAKCEIGLAVGKRQYDKRETIRKKQQQRDVDREMRRRRG